MDTEAEIDRLYGVPLDEFVPERNKLAKRLTKEGDREAAARVKGLRKPTVGAWALNQAVRRRRAETDALLETGERLREAHEQLLGGGDAGKLREAMKEERRLTSALADCAEAIASEGGKSGPALRERVRATLHAASVDEEARSELTAGRFLREREAVGLGAFGTSETAAPEAPGAKRGRSRTGPARRERTPATERRAAKPASARGRPAREERAPDSARSRQEREAEATRAREQREVEAARAREEQLAEAERELAEARAELESAEAGHADALSALESAREALREAEDAERDARRTMRERSREVAKRERGVARLRPKS